ncbi:MAG: carboxymuconolactone decarboxylase family protein [Proteobacteria bacterium]|nr:carboxymuconolactone decarboxylase family protein [Pseudomonadota bacterium]
MSIFSIHGEQTAPEASRPILEGAKAKYGFLPNLLGGLAEAPAALEAYVTLSDIFDKTSLTPAERQVVILATSAENGCEYCVAAHSTIAAMLKVPDDVIEALRDGRPINDERLEALRKYTETVVRKRGWADKDDVQAFLAAGFDRAQVLEIVLGVAFKTLSNYANHLIQTPVDAAFAPRAWTAREAG